MDKQKTIRLALWVVIGIILLLLLRWCEGTGLLGHFKPNTDTLIVHKRDTIRDTVSIVKMKTKRVFDYVEIPVAQNVSGGLFQQIFGSGNVSFPTRMPTHSQISVTLQPIYSRRNIAQNFNMDDFVSGRLMGGTGPGGFI